MIGYAPVARYLLIPNNPLAARWAILLMTVVGALSGYLWWNAEPSKVLMGDALHGVRFPLHDHCKRVLKWSNAQVLMRFMILQAFLTPLLFILFIKVR